MSDTKMTERNMLPKVGASFFRDPDGAVLFQFVLDTSNVIGPRPARRSDQDQHPGPWAAFVAAEGLSSLDRDASGEAGGSLPVESVVPVEAVATHVPPEFDEATLPEPAPKRKYTRKPKG